MPVPRSLAKMVQRAFQTAMTMYANVLQLTQEEIVNNVSIRSLSILKKSCEILQRVLID